VAESIERRGMMLLLKTQVFENAQPESADLSKVQVLILKNSSQVLFSSDRQFHEFQEGKVRPADESD
jgi:hypothetical protein